MSDPNKSYHFEIVCDSDVMAKQIQRLMCDFPWMRRSYEGKSHT